MQALLVMLVIALMMVGSKPLPAIAKSLGPELAECKRTTDEFRRSILAEVQIEPRVHPTPVSLHWKEGASDIDRR
jgi:Sec-independent protein translocase protein TatA